MIIRMTDDSAKNGFHSMLDLDLEGSYYLPYRYRYGRAMVDVTVFCPYYVAQFSCCTSRTVTKAPSWATTGLKPVHCSYTGSEKCPRAEGQTGIRIDDVLDEE
jgi:hypothetical protein